MPTEGTKELVCLDRCRSLWGCSNGTKGINVHPREPGPAKYEKRKRKEERIIIQIITTEVTMSYHANARRSAGPIREHGNAMVYPLTATELVAGHQRLIYVLGENVAMQRWRRAHPNLSWMVVRSPPRALADGFVLVAKLPKGIRMHLFSPRHHPSRTGVLSLSFTHPRVLLTHRSTSKTVDSEVRKSTRNRNFLHASFILAPYLSCRFAKEWPGNS